MVGWTGVLVFIATPAVPASQLGHRGRGAGGRRGGAQASALDSTPRLGFIAHLLEKTATRKGKVQATSQQALVVPGGLPQSLAFLCL